MPRGPVSLREARAMPGLRLVLLKGLPSPWSQAARGIFHVKGLDYMLVHRKEDDPPELLREWTGQESYPVAAYDSETPRSGWAEILFLAERLAPEPALIPRDAATRVLFFGLCREVCGEMGLGWCRRLQSVHRGMQIDPPDPIAKYLGDRYGYSPEAGAASLGRVIEILGLLSEQLRRQRTAGRRFLIGDSLSALDIYWAAFSNLVKPLPPEQLTMPDVFRPIFTSTEPEVLALLEDGLLAHRDFVYREFLELPVSL
jgi:glutathione S-transferase